MGNFFQPYPSYNPWILRTYEELEPPGIEINVEEKTAQCPMESVAIHSFSRIVKCPKWDMESQIDRLTEENGGTLDIECITTVGMDGSR